MCTAACLLKEKLTFGRTLDYDFSYGDKVTITPRNFPFQLKRNPLLSSHFAMIGMAHIANDYPLYYDAMNEHGLAMAGLNFVGNAIYGTKNSDGIELAPHEFIPYVLGKCKNLSEAWKLIEKIKLCDIPFSEEYPCSQLHWIVADKTGSITIESTTNGMFIYENPVCVLTNNPEFPQQLLNLSNYAALSPKSPRNNFVKSMALPQYSRGLGAVGLPGDWSSQSRFIRCVFARENAVLEDSDSVSQLFHILGTVNIPRGVCETDDGDYHITRYTSVCHNGIYYFTTYANRQITAVDMNAENLNESSLICFETDSKENIKFLQTNG